MQVKELTTPFRYRASNMQMQQKMLKIPLKGQKYTVECNRKELPQHRREWQLSSIGMIQQIFHLNENPIDPLKLELLWTYHPQMAAELQVSCYFQSFLCIYLARVCFVGQCNNFFFDEHQELVVQQKKMFPDNRTKEHLLRREIITKMLTKGSKQISVAFHLFLRW